MLFLSKAKVNPSLVPGRSKVSRITCRCISTLETPLCCADARLAGLAPLNGLYASTIPLFVYALLGNSSQLAIGPVGPVAILISSLISSAAAGSDPLSVALQLAFLSGLVQIALGVLRFGFIASLLSWPVMSGYTTAAAFIITASQLSSLLGMPKCKFIPEICILFTIFVLRNHSVLKYSTTHCQLTRAIVLQPSTRSLVFAY